MEVKSIERWGADWEHVVTGELLTVEKPPARRPAVADDGDPGRRHRAAVDRVRRDQHRARAADPGGPARCRAARRPADRARREDGRRVQRDAVLGRGAAADERRRRDPDPARRHAARRAAGRPLWRRRARRGRQAEPRRRAVDPGAGPRGRRGDRAPVRFPEVVVEEGDGPSTAERLAVDVRDPDLCTRFVGRWVSGVTRRPVARSRPDAPPRRRAAAGLERRRRLELRDARARQAGPHVRRRRGPSRARRAGHDRRAARAGGGAPRDARPRASASSRPRCC